ncbi:molybdenum cofactor guanylyltransferase [Paenibacillus tarimensis]
MFENIQAGIIIAGGRSVRMGSDKALLPVGGRPLLAGVTEQVAALCGKVLIVANGEQRLEQYRAVIGEYAPGMKSVVRIVADRYPGSGPLAGLEAGMSELPQQGYAFVLACDMPHISTTLLQRMAERADGAADVVHAAGQPFHALYHTRTAETARRMLEEGDFRFMRLFERLRVTEVSPVSEEEAGAFVNLNTPQAYQRYVDNQENLD